MAMRTSDYRRIEPGPLEEHILNHHPSGRAREDVDALGVATPG